MATPKTQNVVGNSTTKEFKVTGVTPENEFILDTSFRGYRNKEDKTNMPAGFLVEGSQNVVITTGNRISVRPGFTLDGQADTTVSGIKSAFDWLSHTGEEKHLRSGNGKLQYRYVASDGTITWEDLMTGLGTAVDFNYVDWWDSVNEIKSICLFVNGTSNIYEWTGGITSLASATYDSGIINIISVAAGGTGYFPGEVLTMAGGTGGTCTILTTSGGGIVNTVSLTTRGKSYATGIKATTGGSGTACTINITAIATGSITKNGTSTWAEEGFYSSTANSAKKIITINGTDYTYTGGEDSTMLIGISSTPVGEATGSIIHQKVYTNPNSILTGLPTTLNNDLISLLKGQIYIASFTNRSVYISKQGYFDNYTFSATRKIGEGAILTLDSNPVGFIPQESDMYITGGLDDWYKTSFTLSSDNTAEYLQIQRLKTTAQQAAQSQALICKIKNLVCLVNNEPVFDELGRIESNDFSSLATPQSINISDAIKNDFDSYDFTGGSIAYYKNFIYVTVPTLSIVRVYNIAKGWWEAPWSMAISRFSIIEGKLYGHSSILFETYQMLTGYNDNGNPINAVAKFSYQNYGKRALSKFFNEWYVEGYIKSNTTLTCGIVYDIDGNATTISKTLLGTDSQVVALSGTTTSSAKSLGKYSLGKVSLGGSTGLNTANSLPPKFRVIFTTTRKDFYEVQYFFQSNQVDARWELLAFGGKVSESPYGSNDIKI